ADRNRSHWSTSKTPSYTKSVSWQHHQKDFLVMISQYNRLERQLLKNSKAEINALMRKMMTDVYLVMTVFFSNIYSACKLKI
ncbi:hypothetical protein, partial [Escherichia coli]